MHPAWLAPRWSVDDRVGALMSSRDGGVSRGPYAGFNLGVHVGDDAADVATNRARFAEALGATPVFLDQVHGRRVVRLTQGSAASLQGVQADASVTTEAGVACTVMVADCLPVLFAAPGGRGVAAAHAGWRGLAAGVLEATVEALCEAANCEPNELDAWLGACIGPESFEVGAEVLQAFGVSPGGAPGPGAEPLAGCFRPARASHWWADLPELARERLRTRGVQRIAGGEWCTVRDASRFFSFRRDRVTGRMAAAVWLRREIGS
ncbi:peptidoglycan editing factor PgeF [Caldimonas tepidiphila]|uniref:peptidoglycan editing factor PgeF n=1 Tax=Caldimonas tepidiphila TaxID=2315841 RepID=UPI0014737F6D|nr:peptidoglycan editing factor PgeF [Caldimonas tepidiphila]